MDNPFKQPVYKPGRPLTSNRGIARNPKKEEKSFVFWRTEPENQTYSAGEKTFYASSYNRTKEIKRDQLFNESKNYTIGHYLERGIKKEELEAEKLRNMVTLDKMIKKMMVKDDMRDRHEPL